jgi:peptidoglycan hydrolase-like protein with peptidoglycan-binding domain
MSLSNYSASAAQSSGIPPKLKPFKVLAEKLSSTAFHGFLGLAIVTGVLGIATEAEATYMRRGAVGPGVAEVQAALGIPADGIFGRHTQLAVMEFQRRCGLLVDGVVGPETLSALFGGSVAAAPVSTGYASDFVGTPVGTPVPNNILEPGIKPPSAVLPPAVTGPYVVVVPGGSEDKLVEVRRIVPNAVLDGAPRGTFVNAGGYPNYSSAREVAGRLRGFGFDARVDYFERYEASDNPPITEDESTTSTTDSYGTSNTGSYTPYY